MRAPVRIVATIASAPRGVVGLVEDLSALLQSARLIERRALLLLDDIELLVASIRATAASVDVVVADTDTTRRAAGEAIDETRTQLGRSAALLAEVAGHAGSARPLIGRAAEVIEPQHVDGAAQLLDLVPELLDLVLPALRGLSELSPSMNQLGDRLDNIAHIVEGVPGAGRLKRRGTERIEAESATPAITRQP